MSSITSSKKCYVEKKRTSEGNTTQEEYLMGGLCPTIMENHGKILMVIEYESAPKGNDAEEHDDS